jgi:CrcB protein
VTIVLIVLGAMVGAPARYVTDRFVQSRHESAFPWGTLTVNVAGSLLLGLLVGVQASPAVMTLLGSGFCGALSTYSTFSYETLRLLKQRVHFYALANVVASIVAGLGAAYLGFAVGEALRG